MITLQWVDDPQAETNVRFACIFRQLDALDPDTGSRVGHSRARRMTGRPTRFYFVLPDGECKRFAAYSLDEAREKVSRILAKLEGVTA